MIEVGECRYAFCGVLLFDECHFIMVEREHEGRTVSVGSDAIDRELSERARRFPNARARCSRRGTAAIGQEQRDNDSCVHEPSLGTV